MFLKPRWKMLFSILLIFEIGFSAEDFPEDFKSVDLAQLELLQDCAVRTSKNSLTENKILAITKNSNEVSFEFESFYWLSAKLNKKEFWAKSSCLEKKKGTLPCPLYYDEDLSQISPYYLYGKNFKVLLNSDAKKKIEIKQASGYIGSQCFGLPMLYSEKFKNNYDKIYQKQETRLVETKADGTSLSTFGVRFNPSYLDFKLSDSKNNSTEFKSISPLSFGLFYKIVGKEENFEASYYFKSLQISSSSISEQKFSLNSIYLVYQRNDVLPYEGALGFLVKSEQVPYLLNVDNSFKSFYYMVVNAGPGISFDHRVFGNDVKSSVFIFQSAYSHDFSVKGKIGVELKFETSLYRFNSIQLGAFFKFTGQDYQKSETFAGSDIDVNQSLKESLLGLEFKF